MRIYRKSDIGIGEFGKEDHGFIHFLISSLKNKFLGSKYIDAF